MVAHYFLVVLCVHCGLLQAALHMTATEVWFRGCQRPGKNHCLHNALRIKSELLTVTENTSQDLILASLSDLACCHFPSYTHFSIHTDLRSSLACQVSFCLAFYTGYSLCPAFSAFLIFLWLFLSCYSVLSLRDTSSERPFVTTKSKVATRLLACTLSYFSSFTKVDY